MAKEIPQHKDKLGRSLKEGDCVAYPSSNTLYIGIIEKFNPKMIGIKSLGRRSKVNKYPFDIVLLDGPEVTMYLLANQK